MAFIKTVSPEKAEGKIAELYAPVLEMIGSVPKSLEMWSASPTLLELQMGFMGYFMGHQTLDPTLTTTIRYLVSVEFDHQYCANFNGQMLAKMGGLSEDQLKAMGANPEWGRSSGECRMQDPEFRRIHIDVIPDDEPLPVRYERVLRLGRERGGAS